MREIKNKNRVKSLRYFVLGIVSIFVSIHVLKYFLPYIFGESSTIILRQFFVYLFKIFFIGGVLCIMYGIYALLFGDDPDMFEDPF
jgi:hypothetical protein